MADDQPMWGKNRAVAPTPEAAIVAVDLGDNSTVKGHHLSMIKDHQFDGKAQGSDPSQAHLRIVEIVECTSLLEESSLSLNLDWSKENKTKPLRKTIAFVEGEENSPLLEKMEALTTSIDS
ncbi:hypothetical protein Tco_1079426 [Tanacetum coccineum]|uniref:Uncharacterized protein n=1 Tax=Tanacetum coccineum TaxID=301880 RepID=A0ABQ5HSW9_9ASTR